MLLEPVEPCLQASDDSHRLVDGFGYCYASVVMHYLEHISPFVSGCDPDCFYSIAWFVLMRNLYVDVDQLVWKDDLETVLQVVNSVLASVMFGPSNLLHPFWFVEHFAGLMLDVSFKVALELRPIVSVSVCICHHAEYSVC